MVRGSRPLHMKGRELGSPLGSPGAPRESRASRYGRLLGVSGHPDGARNSRSGRSGVRGSGGLDPLLELFKEGHSRLGALQGELLNGVVLAAAAAPVRVLVVQDVQSRLPLFEL